ncbi:MAG: hypothetical protein HC836_15760 [Richelia sp. RM2_1_2]|nr:hypothetical protein [Richelia sp. RM2_1_2]
MKFRIRKNNHWSGLHFGFTLKRKLEFEAEFDDSCIYSIDGVDSWDINKLYGISTSFLHHSQSARIGWRCTDGMNIDLYAYTYAYKKRIIKDDKDAYLGSVIAGERFYCGIEDLGDEYLYTFKKRPNDKPVIIRDKKKKDYWPFCYFLTPYFGGTKKSPHEMLFFIKRL